MSECGPLDAKPSSTWRVRKTKLGLTFQPSLVLQLIAILPPHVPTHQHHGFEGATQHRPHLPIKKGPAQKERDRARAASQRAKQTLEDNNLTTAVAADLSEQDKPPPAASPPPSPSPAAPAGQSHDPKSATLAEFLPPPPSPVPSLPRASVVSFTEVNDEVCQEQKEVKVHATGLFENCPDP